ncbi:hypothetical protein ACFPRL_21075 [Pseudoclavibacter helvolus]
MPEARRRPTCRPPSTASRLPTPERSGAHPAGLGVANGLTIAKGGRRGNPAPAFLSCFVRCYLMASRRVAAAAATSSAP